MGVSSGGSGSPVRIWAGVGSGSCAATTWLTGGAVRASAAATPDATPMNASSAVTSHQNGPRAADPRSSSRPMSTRRYAAPKSPSARSAATLMSTSSPYAVSSRSSEPTRISALTYPEAATTTKHTSATAE